MNYLEKMEIARAIVMKRTPYISTTLFSLIPFAKPGLTKPGPIFTTERLVMAFNPDWWETLTDEEAAAVLFHETQHPVRRHFSRGEPYPDKGRFNIAGDEGINEDTRFAGFTLPKGVVFPETYGHPTGLSAEEYYELLSNDPPPPSEGQGGKGDTPDDSGEGDGDGPGQPGPPCAGNCGGSAGNPGPEEDEVNDAVEAQSPGATKSEAAVESMLKAQAQEILDYVAAGRGAVPGGLVEWAQFQVKPPKVSWRQKLPRILRRALGRMTQGGENYSRARISKRSFIRGLVIPGLISQKPEIVMIRDTSGSMGREQLTDVQNECVGVFKAAGVDSVMFMDADVTANKPKRVSVRDIPKLPITGRGGTDFREAIEVAMKMKPRPKCIMYFTDGDGPAPDRAPAGIEFIWVIISGHYNQAPAPWGHHIFVGPDVA